MPLSVACDPKENHKKLVDRMTKELNIERDNVVDLMTNCFKSFSEMGHEPLTRLAVRMEVFDIFASEEFLRGDNEGLFKQEDIINDLLEHDDVIKNLLHKGCLLGELSNNVTQKSLELYEDKIEINIDDVYHSFAQMIKDMQKEQKSIEPEKDYSFESDEEDYDFEDEDPDFDF